MVLMTYFRYWGARLTYAGIEADPRKFSTYLFTGSFVVGGMVALFLPSSASVEAFAALATIVIIHAVVFAYLLLLSNSRAAKVEEVLPDFFSLVSSNIRAGLTPDRALIVSARDEFGPLTSAISRAGKHSITGMPIDQVLLGIGESINSNVLHKTIRLIVEGVQSGGDMAELLEKTALDIRKFRSVRREVNSIILNYILFILAAVTFGAPLLYGVSSFLVDIMIRIKGKISADPHSLSSVSSQMSIFKGQLLLTPEAVSVFSMVAIVVTVFFGCMAVGVMASGRRVEGLKYFPFLALVALGILLGIKVGLSSIIGGMMGAG